MVIYDHDIHSATRSFNQHIGDLTADTIILKYIILQENRRSRTLQIGQQSLKTWMFRQKRISAHCRDKTSRHTVPRQGGQ